jgi:hypothetical protein
VGFGYFNIQNVSSLKVLDVMWGNKTPGTNVDQYEANGTDAQKWKLVDTGDGDHSYYIVSALNNLYLDLQWGGTSSGTNVWVYSFDGTNAQKFYLNKISNNVPDGVYTFVSGVSSSSPQMVMDVAWGSLDNSASIQLYKSNGTPAQKFKVQYDPGNGYYSIVNVQSGKAVDVKYAGYSSGTNIWQWTAGPNNHAQMWRFAKNNGAYTVVSATGSGCVLDVCSAGKTNGTNIWIYAPNNTNAQKWTLKQVN